MRTLGEYEGMELEVIAFAREDVIASSGGEIDTGWSDEDEPGGCVNEGGGMVIVDP